MLFECARSPKLGCCLRKFFFFFFFLRGPFYRQSRVPAVSAYLVLRSTEALLPGTLVRPLAAAHDRELPAHVCEHFVQLRRLSGDVALSREREFQQGRGDGALGGDGEQPRPTGDPRRTRCRSRGRQNVRRTLPGEQPEPSGRLCAEPAPNLHSDDNQTAAASAHELGVGLAAFASGGAIHSPTGMHISSGLGVARPRHGADDGGINSLLRTMPQGQPVRDDFDAAVIRDRDIDVHVSQANVAGDPRPGFMAHPRHCPLEREGSRCEHTGSRTRSPVVAEGVQATSAGARARCDWQRQAKPSQQQDAEER